MRRAGVVIALVVALAACGAGVTVGATAPARHKPLPRVLVLTQTLGYHHASIPWAVAALRRVAATDGRYEPVFLPTAAELTPSALRGAAAVVFLLTTGDLPLSPAEKSALIAFVRGGGGLIGFHSATDTFHHWPGYIRLIGAEFSHHPLPSTQRIIVEDRSTPATRTLAPSFTIHEEFYVFTQDPRPHVHVLARLDTGAGGPDRPLVWCRRVGRGRVFYDALGHFPQTWSDARQVALVSGGIAWAVGVAGAGGC
jgi:type 1 glutamine amidotransferase